jgi:hypothetical protein
MEAGLGDRWKAISQELVQAQLSFPAAVKQHRWIVVTVVVVYLHTSDGSSSCRQSLFGALDPKWDP